jgi:hypothetical protein
MTHHNQTKEMTTWFLKLPLDESIDNKKHKVLSSNPWPHEAQLEDQKSQEKIKNVIYKKEKSQGQQKHEKRQSKQNGKEEPRKAQSHKTQNSPWNKFP